MASSSSNRHWPSMFRSKQAVGQPLQPQPPPDMSNSPPSLVSGGSSTANACSLKSSSPFSGLSEERNPDPKPRWNPRPEQIRILEAIFNSGMVNPPRDEIPRIRMQLQEYGQVGDANVFYWFQNRKSRSKNKLRAGAGRVAPGRACAPARRESAACPFTPPPPQQQQVQSHQLLASPVAPTSSNSSSSDRSSGSSKPVNPAPAPAMSATAAVMDLLTPLAAASHEQIHYQAQPVAPAPTTPNNKAPEFAATDEPIFLQWPQGHCLSAAELAAILGAQYTHLPMQQQQPPAVASPAGMFLGLCNELATGQSVIGHRSCTSWGAGLGHYGPSGAVDHLVFGRSSAAATNTAGAAARQAAREDATKIGLLQGPYCFGDSAPSLDALLPAACSPDAAAVTVASLAATTAANDAVASNPLQGLADLVGFNDAAAAAPTLAPARGAGGGDAAVCVAGSSAVYSLPAARLDVARTFGEAAVLLRCNGEQVLVDELGLTVEPLQQGAVYCVLI